MTKRIAIFPGSFDPITTGHEDILKRSLRDADGGYVMAGLLGHGDAFVVRDPNGIRPCFYYCNDEIAVVTSERPAIQTGFNIPIREIKELGRGNALIIKKDGTITETNIIPQAENKACSFERIYFSRGNDRDIYKERKQLGYLLADKIMKTVDYDFKNTVFSYIPNTAAVSFYGMVDGINDLLNTHKIEQIKQLGANITDEKLKEILELHPRRERVAVKDAKLRTFITDDTNREDMVAHVYDVTYGIVNNPNEAFVYDASYVKLRELNVTYSIPAKWFNGKTIKGIDVSLIGRNLWIIHKNLPYADPEEVYSAGNVTGHQGGAYPTLRTIGFNLKFKL